MLLAPKTVMKNFFILLLLSGLLLVEAPADYQRHFSIRELDSVPKRIDGKPPVYPPHLKAGHVEGNLKLVVVINESGDVEVIDVIEASHLSFIVPAIRSAESGKFTPPMKDGIPVKAKYIFPFNFRLR